MAPSAELRRELAARVEQISGWLAPAGRDLTAREVASVLLTKPLRNASEQEAEAIAQIYVADLQELPYFALSEACKAFRQNRAGEGKWAPTQGEIFDVAQGFMKAALREKADIRVVLAAQIEKPKISVERRTELSEAARLAAEAMRMNNPGPAVAPKASADARAVPEKSRKEAIQEEIIAGLGRKSVEYGNRPVQLSAAALKLTTKPIHIDELRELI